MAKVLLIEDDAELLEVLSMELEDCGYDVVTATDGEVGLAEIQTGEPDLVISDVNMPRQDGFSLCRKLRAAGNLVPLILLTSRDSEIDEALGLELGADDYISKPFSNRVLLARVAALLRRETLRAGRQQTSPTLETGALSLDAQRIEAIYEGVAMTVTVTEFRILEILAGRPGMVFSRARILDLIRGDDVVVTDRVVDTYIRRLRRKLEQINPRFDEIETVVGAGYRWRG
ncbi:MAG: hypothetical protein A2289_02655 [Deltaproteobacteria bacterium RIFOXYA12_FULL_58_15]|nr:MAG: hypothetical protein A2289_02655 [Deltaproteobacteria bacterium RIFOXYA12_FULL_58_15]OGR13462.1 MAG: hypothetical protein A2341_28070 [Deltaproteobacteria bacterium RIFOXYB12_FULL_58_9]